MEASKEELEQLRLRIIDEINSGKRKFDTVGGAYKEDRDIFFAFVRKDPSVYKKVPTSLRNDDEIATWAIKSNGVLIQYASKRIRNDLNMGQLALKGTPLAISHLGKIPRNDETLMTDFFEKNDYNASYFQYVGKELKSNKNFVEKALTVNGYCISCIDKNFKKSVSLVKLALTGRGRGNVYSKLLEEMRVRDDVIIHSIHESITHRYTAFLKDVTNGFKTQLKTLPQSYWTECIENLDKEDSATLSAPLRLQEILDLTFEYMDTDTIKNLSQTLSNNHLIAICKDKIEKRKIEELNFLGKKYTQRSRRIKIS